MKARRAPSGLGLPFPTNPTLTDVVCWSRMQAESGEQLRTIIARKEMERQASGGVFFWGVGNAPARQMSTLALAGESVDVVFSVMKSRPKRVDAEPDSLLLWSHFVDSYGVVRRLPPGSLVSSRGHTEQGEKWRHYALMCASDAPLALGDLGPFDPSAYRNVGGKQAPIGPSQVTALLRRHTAQQCRIGDYRVNLRARLVGSYWVRLAEPTVIRGRTPNEFSRDMSLAVVSGVAEWRAFVHRIYTESRALRTPVTQPALFRDTSG